MTDEELQTALNAGQTPRDELEAQVKRLRAERDRIAAALAAVVEVSDSESATLDTHFEVLEMARSVLADPARAKMPLLPAMTVDEVAAYIEQWKHGTDSRDIARSLLDELARRAAP